MVALFEKLRRKWEKWSIFLKSWPEARPRDSHLKPPGGPARLGCMSPGNERPLQGQAQGRGHVPSQSPRSPSTALQGARAVDQAPPLLLAGCVTCSQSLNLSEPPLFKRENQRPSREGPSNNFVRRLSSTYYARWLQEPCNL